MKKLCFFLSLILLTSFSFKENHLIQQKKGPVGFEVINNSSLGVVIKRIAYEDPSNGMISTPLSLSQGQSYGPVTIGSNPEVFIRTHGTFDHIDVVNDLDVVVFTQPFDPNQPNWGDYYLDTSNFSVLSYGNKIIVY